MSEDSNCRDMLAASRALESFRSLLDGNPSAKALVASQMDGVIAKLKEDRTDNKIVEELEHIRDALLGRL